MKPPDLDPFVNQAAKDVMSFVIEASVRGIVRTILFALALAFAAGVALGACWR